MAKSLVACRLYKSLSKEASEDYLDLDICEEFRRHAECVPMLRVPHLFHTSSEISVSCPCSCSTIAIRYAYGWSFVRASFTRTRVF